ncbi:MAG: hypothetical protein KGN16_00520 [Burkholderiales bacterium]|nr:hypothetical protein [Burkholderiales bacterium]
MGAVAGMAQALTPFQMDVTTAINNGLAYMETTGAFSNPSSLGWTGASGLAMEALLEKRASGNPSDPPQGYAGANATEQGYLRTAATYIINTGVAGGGRGFYSYTDGSWLFALSSYALSGGPDKSGLGGAANTTIKAAIDGMVNRIVANQNVNGYWCYSNGGCDDSSTTQFAAAGLYAASIFYQSNKTGDGGVPFADAAQLAKVNTALQNVRNAYATYATQGSDNSSGCNVLGGTPIPGSNPPANYPNGTLSATEHGHGYHEHDSFYYPSLPQTASGIYVQLFGGATVNTPMVQSYMEWVRDHYRWDNLGAFSPWGNNTYGYYLWSSFKAMELIRQSAVPVNAGNIGPNDLGTLPAASAPACQYREVNKNPAAYAQVPLFGAGGVGTYAAETAGQYFDYAHQILTMQCANGSFTCGTYPGSWGDAYNSSHNAYSLLVLQRATGVVTQVCDVNGDGEIDKSDITLIMKSIGAHVGPTDVRNPTRTGIVSITDARQCTVACTHALCVH